MARLSARMGSSPRELIDRLVAYGYRPHLLTGRGAGASEHVDDSGTRGRRRATSTCCSSKAVRNSAGAGIGALQALAGRHRARIWVPRRESSRLTRSRGRKVCRAARATSALKASFSKCPRVVHDLLATRDDQASIEVQERESGRARELHFEAGIGEQGAQ